MRPMLAAAGLSHALTFICACAASTQRLPRAEIENVTAEYATSWRGWTE